eukprot:CAMPEP_0201591896 /NCGR_PEP_ID=MMETSP0190_2-20130828/189933_1 /ASSEMBLY_ACC=CAM_ASM_000263 /TAXON_ID=37353 /ORGANISM="Rosalina sp." /LENGTH=306 /DNA_ID=CAMNT_0048050413 /DNA_START=371 /DNA_END=1292 /DNA_ORIENTATION=+
MENDEKNDDINDVDQGIKDIDLDNIDNNQQSKPSEPEQPKTEQPLIQIQDDYAQPVEDDEDDFVEIPDMDEYDDQDNVVTSTQPTQADASTNNNDNTEEKKESGSGQMFKVKEKGGNSILKTRMNASANNESIVENGEWLNMENDETKNDGDIQDIDQGIKDIDLDNVNNNEATKPKSAEQEAPKTEAPLINIQDNYAEPVEDEDDFVEIPDMEDYDDTDNVVANTTSSTNKQDDNDNNKDKEEEKTMFKVSEKGDNEILKTRTYDVSITYDKYYRVPRVWLRGYDENGNPLTSTEIFEDISADHE